MKTRQHTEIIALLLLLSFAFFINRGIAIKGLYMDDLYLWSCYGEQSFREFVFPFGSSRFRFVYYLAAWFQLMIVQNRMGWFVPFNILLNGAISYTVHRFGKRLSGRWTVGLWCWFLYLLSRMSYYQISQVYGLMESLALWAAIGILYCLYRYITEEKEERRFVYIAAFLYFSVSFIHERFMALLPLFYAAFLMRKEKKKTPWLLLAGLFALIQGIRLLTIGNLSPAGTGGTTVADTFRLKTVFRYCLNQVLYILGINAGPDYLNGLSWQASPWQIRLCVLFADLYILGLLAAFLVTLFKQKNQKDQFKQRLCVTGLFLLFIALCIGASSVTIRVETRWIYTSMTVAWLFAAYMCGVASPAKASPVSKKLRLQPSLICCVMFLFYGLLMLPVEQFYRGKYGNLYYWDNQLRYNSLAEETYGNYGEFLFGKRIYILGNTYGMSDFTARTFFKTFDRQRKAEGTMVFFIENIKDIGLVTPNMLIVREEPEKNGFTDVTDFVKRLKLEPVCGLYDDGWLEEQAKIRVMAGKEGKIGLKFYYPGKLTGLEEIKVSINGNQKESIFINSNMVTAELEVSRFQIAELEFESNFYYEAASEQRGEKHLCAVVQITAD